MITTLTTIFGDRGIGMGAHIGTRKKCQVKNWRSHFQTLFIWTKHSICGRGLRSTGQPGMLIITLLLTFPLEHQTSERKGASVYNLLRPDVIGCIITNSKDVFFPPLDPQFPSYRRTAPECRWLGKLLNMPWSLRCIWKGPRDLLTAICTIPFILEQNSETYYRVSGDWRPVVFCSFGEFRSPLMGALSFLYTNLAFNISFTNYIIY